MVNFNETRFSRQFANKGIILEGGPKAVLIRFDLVDNPLVCDWRCSEEPRFNMPCWITLEGYQYAKDPLIQEEAIVLVENPYRPPESWISKLVGKIIFVHSGHVEWGNNICVSAKDVLVWGMDTKKTRKIGDFVELNEVRFIHHVHY